MLHYNPTIHRFDQPVRPGFAPPARTLVIHAECRWAKLDGVRSRSASPPLQPAEDGSEACKPASEPVAAGDAITVPTAAGDAGDGAAGAQGAAEAEQARQERRARKYAELMDDHSAHFIMIRRGITLEGTPEFESFQRTNLHHWDALATLLLQIESVCTQYVVPVATVDGKKLAALCEETGGIGLPPVDKLLACIENIQEVAAVLRMPGRRFAGPHGRHAAATIIQTYARGMAARRVRLLHAALRCCRVQVPAA